MSRIASLTPLVLLAGCLPSSTPPTTPAPTPVAVPQRLVELPPPAQVEVPPARTTRPDTGLERRAAANQIPQLADRWALFGALHDGPVPTVEGGVLVCDLRLPGSPWWKSRPDMQAILEHGGARQILVGENNRDATVVTAPLSHLATGDSLLLRVEDRDLLTKNDPIDGGSVAFPGSFPLLVTGAGGKLHATCRLLRPDAVAERLKAASLVAERGLAAYEGARGVDLTAPDLGYPWSQHRAAEAGLDEVAGLVGWEHPEITARRRRLAEAMAAEARTLAEAVQAQTAKATPAGRAAQRPGGGSLKVVALLCGQAAEARLGRPARDCVVQVEGDGSGAELVWGDGRTEALLPVDDQPDLLALERIGGDRVALEAVLLRVAGGGGAQFWRMP